MERLVLIRHRVAVLLAIGSVPSLALAEERRGGHVASEASEPPRLVVESHVSARPADADILIPPVRSMLQTQGHALGEAALERSLDELPRRNEAPPAHVVDELGELLERGFRHWDEVDFAGAIYVLEHALALSRAHPRMSTESSTIRDRLFRAHVVLALAHKRSQQISSAREVMAELVRGFADRQIPFGQFGPEPGRMRESVQEALREQGMATLTIRLDGAHASAIFINERFVGAGTDVQVELYPGDYRLFALTDEGPGRIREVSLAAGETRSIELDPGFDRALRLTPQPAFVFADEDERRLHEVDYALKLARTSGARGGAILLGTREREDGRVLHGKTITPNHTTLFEGALDLEASVPVEHLYQLGAFLAGAPASPEIEVIGAPALTADAGPTAGPRFGAWSWITMGLGVATLSTGIVLWQLDGRGTCFDDARQCPRLFDTRAAGITATALGTAALSAGTAAFIYDRRQRTSTRHRAAALVPTDDGGWVLSFSGEF